MVEVRQLIASTKENKNGQELQPKEVIATNAQIREHMRQLNEDYKELDRLYQKEKNKRKVRVSVAEMEVESSRKTKNKLSPWSSLILLNQSIHIHIHVYEE